MSNSLPLFYKNPSPLDARAHSDLSLKKNFGLSFASEINAVPVNLIEMPQICHYFPIAFSPDESATPVAILGLRDNENLFINSKGEWLENAYIPAYIRRYPFIFAELPESDQLSLCVDMDDKIIEKNGDQPFFDKDGKASLLSQNALEFCKSYHAAAQQTQDFSKLLLEQDLLIDRAAEINLGNGQKIQFAGFKILNEEKFNKLPDAQFWMDAGMKRVVLSYWRMIPAEYYFLM